MSAFTKVLQDVVREFYNSLSVEHKKKNGDCEMDTFEVKGVNFFLMPRSIHQVVCMSIRSIGYLKLVVIVIDRVNCEDTLFWCMD